MIQKKPSKKVVQFQNINPIEYFAWQLLSEQRDIAYEYDLNDWACHDYETDAVSDIIYKGDKTRAALTDLLNVYLYEDLEEQGQPVLLSIPGENSQYVWYNERLSEKINI